MPDNNTGNKCEIKLKLFIAGTDTDIGKTYISVGLLKLFNNQGLTTIGIKPVASGCEYKNGKLYNADAMLLQEASSRKLPYENINPITFEPAIAPHIAADYAEYQLSVDDIITKTNAALTYDAGVHIVEGVGGWLVPLNNQETMADFVAALNLPVILVIGMRLGCLNHAILTYNAIRQNKINLLGWIANCLDPNMSALTENIDTLREWLNVPCLGVVEYQQSPEDVIDVNSIIIKAGNCLA